MIKQIVTSITLCLFLLLCGEVQTSEAQVREVQIGYVDAQAILARMPEMRAVEQKLQNFMSDLQEEIANREEEYLEERASLEEKMQLPVMSDEAIEREVERIRKMGEDLQSYTEEVQQEYVEKQEEWVGPLLREIRSSINAVAEQRGLTAVLNMRTSSGERVVMYASPEANEKYNITRAVIQHLGI